jgi:branched-chain amino acid transport system substrate-binding protein
MPTCRTSCSRGVPAIARAPTRRSRWIGLAIGAALALGAAAVPAQEVTLGVIAELTGAGATYGRGLVQGAEMAVREVNAAGGIDGRPLRLVVIDGATNPARSAIAMRRLVVADVHMVVGGWGSPQVLANMEVAEQSGMPYIVVGATHPDITSSRNRWTFRVIQTDAVQAEHLAQMVLGTLKARRVAVLADSNAYGAGSRDRFLAALARAGVEPVAVQTYLSTERDFTPVLQRIQAAAPDVLALFGTVPAASLIMNQARAMGIAARFVGTGGLANEALLAAAPQAAEGTLMTSFFSEETDAEAAAWAARFRREFAGDAEPPRPVLAAWQYRTIRDIAVPCLKRAGTQRLALRDCIAGWNGTLFGVAGEVHFDRHHQLVQPPLVTEVRGGAFRLVARQP